MILTAAFLCLFSTLSISQIKVDASAGFAQTPTELSLKRIGFFISVSPLLSLTDNIIIASEITQFLNEK